MLNELKRLNIRYHIIGHGRLTLKQEDLIFLTSKWSLNAFLLNLPN